MQDSDDDDEPTLLGLIYQEGLRKGWMNEWKWRQYNLDNDDEEEEEREKEVNCVYPLLQLTRAATTSLPDWPSILKQKLDKFEYFFFFSSRCASFFKVVCSVNSPTNSKLRANKQLDLFEHRNVVGGNLDFISTDICSTSLYGKFWKWILGERSNQNCMNPLRKLKKSFGFSLETKKRFFLVKQRKVP